MVGQKGVAQILIVIILLSGLLGGLFLVQQTQIFKPKAFNPPISAPINSICNSSISSFSVHEPCLEVNNGFRSIKFSCLESQESQRDSLDLNNQNGLSRQCRTIQDWARIADQACSQICMLTSLPIPEPSGEPVCPAEFPRCNGELIEVPDSSGCPKYICISPVPVSIKVLPSVACKPWEKICQEEGTNSCQPFWACRSSFNDVSASLTGNQAVFNFSYSGSSETTFKIHIAKGSDFTDPIYWSFVTGESSPLINNVPGQTWDQYACGETFYWKVEAVRGAVMSEVQKAQVYCDD